MPVSACEFQGCFEHDLLDSWEYCCPKQLKNKNPRGRREPWAEAPPSPGPRTPAVLSKTQESQVPTLACQGGEAALDLVLSQGGMASPASQVKGTFVLFFRTN